MVSFISPDEYSYSFLLWPKIITATSTEHRTESSCAFLNRPPLRLRNVLFQESAQAFHKDAHVIICIMQRGLLRMESWFAFEMEDAVGNSRLYLHGTISIIFDGLDLNLSASHRCGMLSQWSCTTAATADEEE